MLAPVKPFPVKQYGDLGSLGQMNELAKGTLVAGFGRDASWHIGTEDSTGFLQVQRQSTDFWDLVSRNVIGFYLREGPLCSHAGGGGGDEVVRVVDEVERLRLGEAVHVSRVLER